MDTLIREAFLRRVSTQQVGRVIVSLIREGVSAHAVCNLSHDLGPGGQSLPESRLEDDWTHLFLDGVSLRVRRPSGRQRVQMLVAYGVGRDGSWQLLAFLRSPEESQTAWEGLLNDWERRGLKGTNLKLIITEGWPGLAAAIPTVYPRAAHQRCWVHKMRNILEKVRQRDYAEGKADAQAIYQAESRAQERAACSFSEALDWGVWPDGAPVGTKSAGTTVLHHQALLRGSATSNPFHGLLRQRADVDRIVYSIFQRFNLEWKSRTLKVFTQSA